MVRDPGAGVLGGAGACRDRALHHLPRLKENSFSASTIKVFKDQKVISTGPYALVRHPMYTGALLLALASPLALGSWWGFLPILLVIPALVWRIFDEEKLLKAELPGYAEYANKVRYRLVPLGW
jgi:protein-S-isoprenylcysteine O-methyltransferase Ste14